MAIQNALLHSSRSSQTENPAVQGQFAAAISFSRVPRLLIRPQEPCLGPGSEQQQLERASDADADAE